MKVYVEMSDAKSEWFFNLKQLFQRQFDEHKILPSKGDYVFCLFEEFHEVKGIQWLQGGDVIVWLKTDLSYIEDHWDNWEEEIQEYVDWYNEQSSDYAGKIKNINKQL